jgi:tRNA(Ile)-lysidine synthase
MRRERPTAFAALLGRVSATVRRHQMFLPGESVIVAVSGGPDSTCMLRVLEDLRGLFQIELMVFHFDHHLREDSNVDAAYVREQAEAHGMAFHLREAVDAPAKGDSIEDWAHRARRAALADLLHETGASRAAIGHTRDDRAENVLLAAIRGGGAEALAGIRPVTGPFVRPLIDVTRAEVLACNESLGLTPREDPSNEDTSFLRNALRLEAIPALERATGRDVKAALARTSEHLREDADELQRLAHVAAGALVDEEPEGYAIAAVGLLELPMAIAGRVVRDVIYRAGMMPSAELIDAVLDLAAGRPGRRRDLPGHSTATRDREYVHLPRSSPEGRSNDTP